MKQRIVIADDDLTIRSLVSVGLGLASFDVLSAENGPDALKLIREHKPCAVLLDVRMPGGGLETLDAIRSDSRMRDLPVMMLTGERDPSTVVAAMGAGASDYMVKPFHNDQLLERIHRLLEAPPPKKEAPVKPARPARPVWEL